MKDLQYLLGSCLTENELQKYENELLNFYFDNLKLFIKSNECLLLNKNLKNINYNELKNEWMDLYYISIADFQRFLLGWNGNHYKINGYTKKVVNNVLNKI